MYLDWDMSDRDYYFIDVEGDSLSPTVLWCMCWENIRTRETGEAVGIESIRSFFEETRGAVYVAHNMLKFDGPVLRRLAQVGLTIDDLVDTLVLSTCYSPNIENGHSLGAWGERMGIPKGDHNDFSCFSEKMLQYCHQDVKIGASLFRRLVSTLRRINFSEQSVWIQHRLTVILERQRKNGFKFNVPKAQTLYRSLRDLEASYESSIHEVFPPELRELGSFAKAYKRDGTYSAIYLNHRDKYEICRIEDDGTYKVFGRIPFNIGSPKQRVEKLVELGWDPLERTEKGHPQPFIKGDLSPSLKAFLEVEDNKAVRSIARWLTVNGRANMLNTWLDNVHDDGFMHGKLFTADTLRLRHQSPNTANVPGVRTRKDGTVLLGEDGDWTYESRDCWEAREGRLLCGTDASGLELRMLCNYLGRPAFTEQVINGDPHQYNADTVGIPRPNAKTLLYAIQYGAQDRKVAKMLNISLPEGKTIREQFLERLGLKGVMEAAQYEQQNGRIELVDGSMIVCPSKHAALNYKLQGGGARVMAMGAIILERYIKQDGLDSLKVGDIHDEWQYDVDPDDAEQHGKRSTQAIREAGEELNMNVPLGGKYKIGKTWAQTH